MHYRRSHKAIWITFWCEFGGTLFTSGGCWSSELSSINDLSNSVKDRETSEYPYVELFRDLASATCRPNSTLVTYGYSFGDEHINRVIIDMLTIPSTHIVIIAYGDHSVELCAL